CEKAFPTKGELASHSRCHLKVPAFLCGICGRPFKRRTDYVRHVRNVHEEVGRYSCNQCGERFGRLDKLKRH
ncbi:zinc finger protein, partial [Linnemannia elongata]